MGRRCRIVPAVLAIGSAAVALLAAVLWVRGYWVGYPVGLNVGRYGAGLITQPGMFRWSISRCDQPPSPPSPIFSVSSIRWGEVVPTPPQLAAMGMRNGPMRPYVPKGARWGFSFDYHRGHGDIGVSVIEVSTPPWLIVLIGLYLPCTSLLRVRRRRARLSRGLCVSCGYDMRASTERCPECGAVPA